MARVRVACREAASFREPRAALSAAVDIAARGRRGKGEGEEEVAPDVAVKRQRTQSAFPSEVQAWFNFGHWFSSQSESIELIRLVNARGWFNAAFMIWVSRHHPCSRQCLHLHDLAAAFQ